jgi:AhpD family alkylhydroperoxidase
MDDRMRTLIALAAALAAGCPSCLETHWQDAERIGVSAEDRAEAIRIARTVRVTALLAMDALAEQLPQRVDIPLLGPNTTGCGPGCQCEGVPNDGRDF